MVVSRAPWTPSGNTRTAAVGLTRLTSLRVPRVCYERTTWNPTVQTFVLSAIWHGVYPGYYLTFLTGVLMTLAARAVSARVPSLPTAALGPAQRRAGGWPGAPGAPPGAAEKPAHGRHPPVGMVVAELSEGAGNVQ